MKQTGAVGQKGEPMRLIDADATIYALNVASRGDSKDVIRNLVSCFLLASPTVDAVPVIRCKDCKHMHEDGVESYCDDSGRYIDGTGFCSWAERKEE